MIPSSRQPFLFILTTLILVSCGPKKPEDNVPPEKDPLTLDLKNQPLIDAENTVEEPFPG